MRITVYPESLYTCLSFLPRANIRKTLTDVFDTQIIVGSSVAVVIHIAPATNDMILYDSCMHLSDFQYTQSVNKLWSVSSYPQCR